MTLSVLVTGASGFLGSRLVCQLVNAGWVTTALLREGSKLEALETAGLLGKITIARLGPQFDGLRDVLLRVRPDVVLHTAAISRSGESARDIQDLIQANVLFPSLMLAHMREAGCTALVNAGTSWQNCAGAHFSPFNVYAASKQAFEDVIESFCLEGLQAVTLRLFDTYGPGDTRNKIVDLVIRATLTGVALKMSPGEQIIDLVHIEDVARAFVVAAERVHASATPRHDVYGVSGTRIRLRALAGMIGELARQSVPIIWGARPYRPREIMVPFDGLARVPGWKPGIDLRDGIQAQLQYWRDSIISNRSE